MMENPPASAGDVGDMCSIPGLGRSPGVRNGYPLQYPCLGNPMDRGVRWASDHGTTESQTRLSTSTVPQEPEPGSLPGHHAPLSAAAPEPLPPGVSPPGPPSAGELHRAVLSTHLCLILCDPWTVAHQAPLSMEFSRQKYWSE